ncbi:MAG TPA: choice-of-anchor J domain-containing protein, partial [Bacteroidia bacterium]
QSSDGCTPVNLVANDASVFNVTSPTGAGCNTTITPAITLKNMGSGAMTSCTINYSVDGGAAVPYSWTGNLASLATTTVTLPSSTATPGSHTITVTTSSPNGASDGNATNDQGTSTFTILGGTGVAMPFTEGFESTTFVPAGWQLNNPDGADTWERTTLAKRTGVASMRMDNYTNAHQGESDAVITPMIDLTSAASPTLTFQLSYRLYTNPTASPNYSDTLEVLISQDCGTTWTSIYKKFGTNLVTTPSPYYANNEFTPTTNAQWRQETVSLASYASVSNAMFKFRNGSDYENHLYIDDISIAGTVGIKEKDAFSVSVNVYPNPTNGMLNVEVSNPVGSVSELSVYNVIGEKVLAPVIVKGSYAVQTIDLSALANGVYQLEVKADGKSSFKKFVINK